MSSRPAEVKAQKQINCKFSTNGPDLVLLFKEHFQGREYVVSASPIRSQDFTEPSLASRTALAR